MNLQPARPKTNKARSAREIRCIEIAAGIDITTAVIVVERYLLFADSMKAVTNAAH